MTEKFNELKLDIDQSFLSIENPNFLLKQLLKETISKILSMLKHICKNYPEKIKSFLLEYNSYVFLLLKLKISYNLYFIKVILKKLHSYFDNDEKLLRKSSKLIKIQLPYFTKKKKNTAGNMKMISEIYAKFREPNEIIDKESYVLSKFDKYEKNNLKNRPNTIVDNPEILR